MIFIVIIFFSCKESEQKPGICLSFDDNYLEQWVGILPLLDKYDAKATFFLTGVGKLSEQEKAWLKEIQEAGHEIGAHGELHVPANSYIQSNGYRSYWQEEIQANVDALRAIDIRPKVFAYPYGEKNRIMDIALRITFQVSRSVVPLGEGYEEKALKKRPGFHYYSISIDESELPQVEKLKPLMERAKAEKKVLFIHAHTIGEQGAYTLSAQRLETVLAMGKDMGLDFRSIQNL